MPFILNISNFNQKESPPNGFSVEVLEILSEEKADTFIELQNQAIKEITQEINVLSKVGLMTDFPLRYKYLLLSLIYKDEILIGYGYSYKDEDKDTIYIDTIYILKEFRKLRLSYFLIETLIAKCINLFPKVNRIKAVTQPDNKTAIKLLSTLGFQYTNNI